MSTETVVSRLHDAVTNIHGPAAVQRGLILSAADAVALDKLIASLCEEEASCTYCTTRLCHVCGIGERGDADDCPETHCMACADRCQECRDLIGDDAALASVLDGRWS